MKNRHLIGLLALCVAGVGLAADKDGTAGTSTPSPAITPSPAFTPAQLTQLPTTSWPTNGGNLFNQRYSPLQQLNRDNVKELKAVWRASLRGSGLDPKHSGQGQMLEYEGVLYVITGNDDVFAISVDTGAVLWEYKSNMDANNVFVCCGWAARGVGMGDGRIYVGQLDNKVVALDQKTGKVVWTTQSQTKADGGYSITMAPLYYDGMVIIGHSGGEQGIRGRVKALDARTGKEIWRWYTVPAPGEPGSETWPKNSDVWQYGGGAVWSTPAVDPELGLIYFPVANPAPDLNGHVREGDNLFTSSIVALEVKTGKYRWHYQHTHHDIWDYGGANPLILFDVTINGKPRKGLSHAPKSGYVYILDRVTGKPLVGIKETPVPQNASQKTSPTQPIPVGDDVVPHFMDAAIEGYELVNEGRTFTPFDETPVPYKQLAGINWPPMSYDVEDHLLYVCANDSVGVVRRDGESFTPPEERGKAFIGGSWGSVNVPRRGIVAALDVTTQKIKWRRQWAEPCNSGTVNTAGGLLFVGRRDGRIQALDKRNGASLWEWQLDAPVSAPVTTFEYRGQQMVAVYAAGGYYSGSFRGDGVWLLSRSGTMKPSLPLAEVVPAKPTVVADTRGGRADDGAKVYQRICEPCHGPTGKGGHAEGAVLPDNVSAQAAMTKAMTGGKDMPSFEKVLTTQELKDVAAYVQKLVAK